METKNSIDHAKVRVPFPKEKILTYKGQLENLFHGDRLPDFTSLPDSLTSVGIDVYASWLAETTKRDPNHAERGAFLPYNLSTQNLLYPLNPVVGIPTNNGEQGTVFPLPPIRQRLAPFLRVHSHPDATCFSSADLTRSICDPGFLMEVVGTQENNYLLLRTEQTYHVDNQTLEKITDDIILFQQKTQSSRTSGFNEAVENGRMPQDVADYMVATMQKHEKRMFHGSTYARHIGTFIVAQEVANEFELGLYVSHKDGIFRRFTPEMLDQIRHQGTIATEQAWEDIKNGVEL